MKENGLNSNFAWDTTMGNFFFNSKFSIVVALLLSVLHDFYVSTY